MKKLMLFVFLASMLAACSQIPSTPITFTDGLGQQVTLAQPAKTIVSLAPSNTEILFAVGAGSQVVGRDDFSDFPADASAITTVGANPYNLEQIVALKPDLVLLAEINTPELASQLKDLGVPTFYIKNPTSFAELYNNIELVGSLSGHKEEAKTLTASLSARVAVVEEKMKSVSSSPVVYYELDASDPAKPWTVGPGTFIQLVLDNAKAQNFTVVSGVTEPYPQISIEQVVKIDPDYILLGDAAWGVSVESVGQRPGWADLKAVKQGNVLPFDDNIVSRPGPRLVDALEQLSQLLHP